MKNANKIIDNLMLEFGFRRKREVAASFEYLDCQKSDSTKPFIKDVSRKCDFKKQKL